MKQFLKVNTQKLPLQAAETPSREEGISGRGLYLVEQYPGNEVERRVEVGRLDADVVQEVLALGRAVTLVHLLEGRLRDIGGRHALFT